MENGALICSCAAAYDCQFLEKAARNPEGWRGPDGVVHKAEPAWFYVRPGTSQFCCYPTAPCPEHAEPPAALETPAGTLYGPPLSEAEKAQIRAQLGGPYTDLPGDPDYDRTQEWAPGASMEQLRALAEEPAGMLTEGGPVIEWDGDIESTPEAAAEFALAATSEWLRTTADHCTMGSDPMRRLAAAYQAIAARLSPSVRLRHARTSALLADVSCCEARQAGQDMLVSIPGELWNEIVTDFGPES